VRAKQAVADVLIDRVERLGRQVAPYVVVKNVAV
jgi:hypothetical protein